LNDFLHIGRVARFAGQGGDAFFCLGVDATLARRKLISLNLFLLLQFWLLIALDLFLLF
jgi:hypothetical protein